MFERAFRLWRECLRVLRLNPSLMVFPAVAFVAFGAIFTQLFLPIMDALNFDEPGIGEYFMLVVFYAVFYTVILVCNGALVGCALLHFEGKDPTLWDGVKTSLANLHQLIGWALFASTIAVLLRALREKLPGGGSLMAFTLELSWSLATYLVLPVLIAKRWGPTDSAAYSARLLKSTWGEQVTGKGGLGIVIFLLALLGLVPGVASYTLADAAYMRQIVTLTVVYWFTLGVLFSALHSIYRAAVYEYAENGVVPEGFDPGSVENAFIDDEMAAGTSDDEIEAPNPPETSIEAYRDPKDPPRNPYGADRPPRRFS